MFDKATCIVMMVPVSLPDTKSLATLCDTPTDVHHARKERFLSINLCLTNFFRSSIFMGGVYPFIFLQPNKFKQSIKSLGPKR
jgi:hypothetical protein